MELQPTSSAPKQLNKWIDLSAIIIWLLPVAYLLFNYPALPDTVPMHFDGKGRADGFGSKQTHLAVMLGMAAFNIAIYLLVRNIHRIDPKAIARLPHKTYRNLAIAILIFLSALHVIITHATARGEFNIDKLVFVLMGCFFSYLGWIMKDIEPNYFVGIRTPWTLEDPENWKATHRMASRYFLWGGLAVALASLLFGRPEVIYVCISGIFLIAVVPVAYSFQYFRKKRSKG
jgi:uncharacterized membrane protein